MDAPVSLQMTDEAFPYLSIQRGGIADLAADRARWTVAYNRQLAEQVDSLRPYLPAGHEPADYAILDVGSGLGGVDILLQRECPGARVTLLDGVEDPPHMHLHRETFNSMAVAWRWWQVNGGRPFSYVDAATMRQTLFPGPDLGEARLFNLVVSFGSWCFHYPPALYLNWLLPRLAPKALVCLEVRGSKPEWRRELARAFGVAPLMIHGSLKFSRLLYRLP